MLTTYKIITRKHIIGFVLSASLLAGQTVVVPALGAASHADTNHGASASIKLAAVTGAIVGAISGPGGGPAVASVQLFSNKFSDNSIASMTSVAASGRYTFTGLSAGTYFVKFANTGSSNYIEESYDNVPLLTQSTPITVSAGTTQTANAQLAAGAVISGSVTRDEGGANWALMRVELRTSPDRYAPIYKLIVPASNGDFRVQGLTPGSYYIYYNTFHDSDFLSEWFNDTMSQTLASPVALTSGTTTTVNAALARGGVIVGDLTDEIDVTPVGGTVYAYPSRTGGSYSAYGYTREGSGRYTITGMNPGVYYLGVEVGSMFNNFGEFYNNQPTRDTAHPYTVSANMTTTLNFALARGARITGTITEVGSGTPVANVNVSARRETGGDSEYGYATSDARGIYTVTQLTGGGYSLYFQPNTNHLDTYLGLTTTSPGTIVTVTAQGLLQNQNIQLSLAGQLLGRVTAADTSHGLDDVYIEIERKVDANYQSVGGSIETDVAGYYTVPQLSTGQYRVRFRAGSGAARTYLSEYHLDATTKELATDVAVTAGATTTGIDAVLSLGGSISGTIIASDTLLPLHLVSINVYSGTDIVASTSTGSNGKYETPGVSPGAYSLRFVPNTSWPTTKEYAPAWYNSGLSVTVTGGQVMSNINASLERGAVLAGNVKFSPGSFAYVRVYDAQTGERLRQAFYSGAGDLDYSVIGLPAGTYKLGFYGGTVGSLARGSVSYNEVYYNQKATLAAADVITVSAAQTITGLDGRVVSNVNASPKAMLPLVTR